MHISQILFYLRVRRLIQKNSTSPHIVKTICMIYVIRFQNTLRLSSSINLIIAKTEFK